MVLFKIESTDILVESTRDRISGKIAAAYQTLVDQINELLDN